MQEYTRSSRVTRGQNSEANQKQSGSGRPSRKSASSGKVADSENMSRRSRKSTSPVTAANSERTITTRKRRRRSLSESESPVPKKSLIEKMPKFRTKIVDGKEIKIDAYCWQCHLPTEELDCPHCVRVYHTHCLKKSKANSDDFCECRLTSVSGIKSVFLSEKSLNETLKLVFVEAAQERNPSQKKNSGGKLKFLNRVRTWPKLMKNDFLVRIIDLEYILDNLNDTAWYSSTAEFFADVKWIYHNCCIVYGSDDDITLSAHTYLKYIKLELVDMEACVECYNNKNRNFTNVCKKPHPIVWAKLRGSPIWPAKCLGVTNGHADVRFFGTHDKSVILLDQVYKISHEPPNKNNQNNRSSSRITSATLKRNEAMKELCIYVTEYERIFGQSSFKYHSSGTLLVPKVMNSVRRGRHKRGRSRNKQNDVSLNESISDSSLDQQPSINLSVLHDANIETKVKASLGLPLSEIAFSKGTNEEPNDPMINMVYEVSHETTQDDFVEESPGSQGSFSGNQSDHVSVSSVSIVADTDLSSAKETVINTAKDNSNSGHFVNANTSDSLPVITSAMSPFDVTSAHVVDDNPLATLAGFPSFSTSSDASPSNTQKRCETNTNPSPQPDENEVLLLQEFRRNDILTQSLKENAPMTKTFCELLLSNRPNARRQLAWLQTVVTQCYLHMWVDVNGKKLDANDFNTFYKIYAELVTKIKKIESENKSLKTEVDKLNSEMSTLKDQTKIDLRNDFKNELMQAQLVKLNDRITKQKEEIVDKERKLQLCEEERSTFEKKLNEMEKQLEEYQLEIQLQEKNSNKILHDSQSQTDISGAISGKNDYSPTKAGFLEKLITNSISNPSEIISNPSGEGYIDVNIQAVVFEPNPSNTSLQPVVTSVMDTGFSSFVSSNPQLMPSVLPFTVLNEQQVRMQQNTQVIQAAQMTPQQNMQMLQSSYVSSECTSMSHNSSRPLKTYAGSKLRNLSKNSSKKNK